MLKRVRERLGILVTPALELGIPTLPEVLSSWVLMAFSLKGSGHSWNYHTHAVSPGRCQGEVAVRLPPVPQPCEHTRAGEPGASFPVGELKMKCVSPVLCSTHSRWSCMGAWLFSLGATEPRAGSLSA